MKTRFFFSLGKGSVFFYSVEREKCIDPSLLRGSKEEASFERFGCFLSKSLKDAAESIFCHLSCVR